MSHEKQIFNHLKSGKSITAIEALSLYGCLRLAARIEEIRNDGFPVQSKIISQNGKRFARYSLAVPASEATGISSSHGKESASTGWVEKLGEVAKTRHPATNRQDMLFDLKPEIKYRNHWE